MGASARSALALSPACRTYYARVYKCLGHLLRTLAFFGACGVARATLIGMLIFAAVLANVLTLDSDGAVTRAREKHAQLLIMMHSPHDHACTLAAPMFRNLADA